MPKALLAVAIGLLLLPCIVMAQYDWVAEDEEDAWAVRVGWADLGDGGDGVMIGVDRIINKGGRKWLIGLDWADGDPMRRRVISRSANTAITATTGSISLISLNVNYVIPVAAEAAGYQWYYGAGIGAYRLENGSSDNSFGGQLLAGIKLKRNFFGELRYVLGTDFDNGDADGLRATIGLSF